MFKNRSGSDAGTAMVDALIAMVIVSLTVAMCLATLKISRRASFAAQTDQKARLLLQTLIETTPRTPGVYSGKRDGMIYAVTVTEQKARGVRQCALRAEASQKGRAWQLEGTRWCDQETRL